MPKYAPAREDGLKPWVVTVRTWGRADDRLIWAESNGAAKYAEVGRQMYTTGTARRATPEDVEDLSLRTSDGARMSPDAAHNPQERTP